LTLYPLIAMLIYTAIVNPGYLTTMIYTHVYDEEVEHALRGLRAGRRS